MDWKVKNYTVKRTLKTATVKTEWGEIHLRELFSENGPMTHRATAVINGEEVLRYYSEGNRDWVVNELTNLLKGRKIRGYDAMSGQPFYEQEAK